MENCQDNQYLVSLPEVDRVWKAPQYGALNIAEDRRVALGVGGRPFDRLTNFVQELLA